MKDRKNDQKTIYLNHPRDSEVLTDGENQNTTMKVKQMQQ